jgi:Uncharacterized conserved protein
MLQVTTKWRVACPGACVGALVVDGVVNPDYDDRLETAKRELEERLRAQFRTREDLREFGPVSIYREYYRHFGKTYPVMLQMESVAIKGKPFPSSAALVEAMFMAEVKSGLLTAGHDRERIKTPLALDIAADGEEYTGIGSRLLATKAGDMLLRDGTGVISSIVGGPDFRTRITSATTKALFVVYAPPGIGRGLIERHFDDLLANIRLFATAAKEAGRAIYR